MIKASIKIDKRRKSKNGYPVKIQISGAGKRKMISTGIYTGDSGYRATIKRKEVELMDRVDFCNDHSLSFEKSVEYICGQASTEITLSVLKKQIRELEGGALVYPFWDTLIKEKESTGKSIRTMIDSKKQIAKFHPNPLYFSDITYEWINRFIVQKYKLGCGPGGVSVYLRSLRTVYLEAQRRESMGVPSGNPFKGVIPKARRKEPVQLSKSDLSRIANYEPRKGTTEKNAANLRKRLDIFLFQIYIGGHDLADVSRLTWKDVKGNRVRFTRHKNRNRETILVDNPLLPEALEIIEKHGTPDHPRVFEWIPITPHSYRTYTGHTRRALRIVSKDLDLPKLTTKSPRYIFKSWAGQSGANFEAVMQIMGHKEGAVPFGYQGRFPNRIIDKVLAQVLDIYQES